MSKKNIPSTKDTSGALTHNPFADLAGRPQCAASSASPHTIAPVKRAAPIKPLSPPKLRVRLESTGRSGKVVTRISGLPAENLEAIASRLRKALGCGATLDGNDVLLLGTLADRALQWLDRVGDLQAIRSEQVTLASLKAASPAAHQAASNAASSASGTQRSDVRRGQRVAIVMKADQSSGALTEGVVRELLTSSATHPRGIKVRLESGEVGRVKTVYG